MRYFSTPILRHIQIASRRIPSLGVAVRLQRCWHRLCVASRVWQMSPKHTRLSPPMSCTPQSGTWAPSARLLTRLPPRCLPRPGASQRSAGTKSLPSVSTMAARAGGTGGRPTARDPHARASPPEHRVERAGREAPSSATSPQSRRLSLPLLSEASSWARRAQLWALGGIPGSRPEAPRPPPLPVLAQPRVPSRARTLLQTSMMAFRARAHRPPPHGGRAVWQLRTKLQHATA